MQSFKLLSVCMKLQIRQIRGQFRFQNRTYKGRKKVAKKEKKKRKNTASANKHSREGLKLNNTQRYP